MSKQANSPNEDHLAWWLGRLGFVSTLIGAGILSLVLVGNLATLAWGIVFNGVVLRGATALATMLGAVSTGISYYGRWRLVRGKEHLNIRDEATDQALDTPSRLQDLPTRLRSQFGCSAVFSSFLVVVGMLVLLGQPGQSSSTRHAVRLLPTPNATAFLPTSIPATATIAATALPTATLLPAPTATATATATATPVIPPIITVIPLSTQQTCSSTLTLDPMIFTLDASGSAVAATWQMTPQEPIPGAPGTPWASVTPSSATTPAGQRVTVMVIPDPAICSKLPIDGATFHVRIDVKGGSAILIAVKLIPFIIF
jgi:hypothetical protein